MAYAAWSVVAGEQPTAAKWNILGTNDASFNDGSGFAAGAIGATAAAIAGGIAVQRVSTNFSAVATGVTAIPYDDTIPQITEGTEFMTQAITPKSATNRLVVDVVMLISANGAAELVGALFQDSSVNALAATFPYQATATGAMTLYIRHDMVAGTTSATTFRVRAGTNGGNTVTINGSSGLRKLGGVTISNITVTEVKV